MKQKHGPSFLVWMKEESPLQEYQEGILKKVKSFLRCGKSEIQQLILPVIAQRSKQKNPWN